MKSSLREQLPYIGSVGPDGSVIIDVYSLKDCPYFSRPDYEEFKRTVYNSERDCASVLLGCDASTLYTVAGIQEERRMKIVQETFPDSNYEFPKLKHLSDAEWRAYNDISSLILDIKTMLEDGRMMEELKGYSYPKNSSDIGNYYIFDSFHRFHSLYFLEWAEKNSFKIPDELKICRDDKGLLKYSESTIQKDLRHVSHSHTRSLNVQSYADAELILKYKNKAIAFCKDKKNSEEQLPTKTEINNFIEICLKKDNESLGPCSLLPREALEEILKAIPTGELRRGRGITTKK